MVRFFLTRTLLDISSFSFKHYNRDTTNENSRSMIDRVFSKGVWSTRRRICIQLSDFFFNFGRFRVFCFGQNVRRHVHLLYNLFNVGKIPDRSHVREDYTNDYETSSKVKSTKRNFLSELSY